MKLSCILVALAAMNVVGFVNAQSNLPLTSVVSVSHQFTAFAPGMVLPAQIATFAEQIKHDWLDNLGVPDGWRDPITIVVRSPGTNAVIGASIKIGLIQVGPILKYEIDCWVPPPLNDRTLAPAIVEALCLEAVNREHPRGTVKTWSSTPVPPWLVEGMTDALDIRPERLLEIARRSSQSGRPPEATSLLNATSLPADAAEREIFAANAWLLTEGLRRLPAGQRKLQHFLFGLRGARNAADLFYDIYHSDFADAEALEKWWSLQQAHLKLVVVPQDLTAQETGSRLDELLIFPEGLKFNQLMRHADQDWLRKMLPDRLLMLQALLSRAHPMYRPVLESYMEATQLLMQQKLNRFMRAVHQAETQRADADKQMSEIHSVLDHHEMTDTSSVGTNSFQGYFKMLKQADEFERQRRNPISDYLDQFDR